MKQILKDLKIKADVIQYTSNGILDKYYLRMHPGGRVKKIEQCATEIAIALKSYSIPTVRLMLDEGLVSVEVMVAPQKKVDWCEPLHSEAHIPITIGQSYMGKNLVVDMASMPHLLIAGTTGSGKSVLLHSIICSIISNDARSHNQDAFKLVLIDPKSVEFNCYSKTKQLMYPIVNDGDGALSILSDLVDEMENRFSIMARCSVNEISEYNKKNLRKRMPYIVVVIDEYADLMQSAKKEFQMQLSRLAQKSRACGIHMITATQRPSADIVTGVIKANFPARISCRVSSSVNSRVVLDRVGAEKLLGQGDALINTDRYDMLRFKGAYITSDKIEALCENNERSKLNRFLNWLR